MTCTTRARQSKQTHADCAMSMIVLSSTKVRPDNVSQMKNSVQPTQVLVSRNLRRNRVFRDRKNPLDMYDDVEFIRQV